MNDKQLWDKAYALATQSNCNKRMVGCVIYNNAVEKIVGEGYNYHNDDTCDCYTTKTAIHAEVEAVNSITHIHNKEDLIAYVTRRPCNNCFSLLSDSVGEIRYKT